MREVAYKQEGVIQSASFGMGGYQNQCLGLWLHFEGLDRGWFVGGSISGHWRFGIRPTEHSNWDGFDQGVAMVKMLKEVERTLCRFGCRTVDELAGKKVKVSFDSSGQFVDFEPWA